MSKYAISVVVPVYNTAQYLDKCIESLLAQTLNNIEIILVDDASPDEAPKLCDEWSKRYDNISVIHKENEGLGLTRNAGLAKAQGDYVCFLDSDDTLDPDTLASCYDALDGQGADACFYGRKTGKADGSYSINSNIPKKLVYEGEEVKKLYACTYLGPMPDSVGVAYIQASACCAMYRRSIIEEHNIRFMSERVVLSEDTFFNLEICKYAKKVMIIPKDFYNYTYNAGSLTKKYNPNRFNQLKNFYAELLKVKPEFADSDNVDIRVPYQFYIYLRHTIEYEVKSKDINGAAKTRKRIREICEDEFVARNIKTIDKDKLNLKRKMLVNMIEKKQVPAIIAYYSFKKD